MLSGGSKWKSDCMFARAVRLYGWSYFTDSNRDPNAHSRTARLRSE